MRFQDWLLYLFRLRPQQGFRLQRGLLGGKFPDSFIWVFKLTIRYHTSSTTTLLHRRSIEQVSNEPVLTGKRQGVFRTFPTLSRQCLTLSLKYICFPSIFHTITCLPTFFILLLPCLYIRLPKVCSSLDVCWSLYVCIRESDDSFLVSRLLDRSYALCDITVGFITTSCQGGRADHV
jgi:hypothetical protein